MTNPQAQKILENQDSPIRPKEDFYKISGIDGKLGLLRDNI